jgi:hypothetical protein
VKVPEIVTVSFKEKLYGDNWPGIKFCGKEELLIRVPQPIGITAKSKNIGGTVSFIVNPFVIGFRGWSELFRNSKCRCGPLESPESPEYPMILPFSTGYSSSVKYLFTKYD